MIMLNVQDRFPQFKLTAVNERPITEINMDNVFKEISHDTYQGKWLIAFFYPKNFTFVCPTEIAAFGNLNEDFQDREAQVLGFSTDSEFAHWSWRKSQEELKNLPFPLVSDIKRELTSALGILDKDEGVAQRATYIVDPNGIIRFAMVTDLNVGRNPKEVLRILDALQTDELCPCNWHKGEQTINTSDLK